MRAKRARLQTIVERLRQEYPEAECALIHENPVQLLVATILSAQCTDERVNRVTPGLFQKYPDAAALAAVDPAELEREIHSTGFFRNKAKNIRSCCQALVEDHDGVVPREMKDLVKLPGVGRKTANVVLGACFDLPAITVDTHCGRLSRRLGLTANTDPEKVEKDLQQILPQAHWWFFSTAIIWHGRRVCHSRRPACDRCVLTDLCPSSTAPALAADRTPIPFDGAQAQSSGEALLS
ncbi:MAG TPA: endonuclease III [Armatimonadota bacterium]|nr:endonuclease III [Armatimonadota bacterium]